MEKTEGQGVSLAVIGGGSMGSAFVDGALQARFLEAAKVQVYEPESSRHAFFGARGVRCFTAPGQEIGKADLVLLAVKPQVAPAVCAEYLPFLSRGQLVLSIMAGTPASALRGWLGDGVQVVRCMPNLPVLAQSGVSVFWKDPALDAAALRLVEGLLSSVGICLGVESETLVDAATAISGSGPGYLFYIAEALCGAAQSLGFSAEEAELLVRHTVSGTGTLWSLKGGAAEGWRKQVTSKGGTTEACLALWNEQQLHQIIAQGVQRAFQRAQELSGRVA